MEPPSHDRQALREAGHASPEAAAPPNHGSLMLLVSVLASPGVTFAAVARAGSGYGSLLVWLALELLLAEPHTVAASVARLPHQPVVALAGLWSRYLSFALSPALLMFMVGAVLYFLLRRHPTLRLDLWAAASLAACAWAPHVLLTGVSSIAVLCGLDHAVMPQYRFAQVRLSPGVALAKAIVELGPSVVYGAVGLRGLRRAVTGVVPARPRLLRVGAVVAVLLLGGATASAVRLVQGWDETRPLLPGDQLPAMTLVDLQGQAVPAAHDAGDQAVTLVEFWATWCGACVASMPAVESIYQELRGQRFRLISVNAEAGSAERVRAFTREQGLSFPVYLGSDQLLARFRIDSFPTFLLADRAGTIRSVYAGSLDVDALRRDIRLLLGAVR